MPNSSGYTSHLSTEAVAFVVSLPKRRQRKILDIADTIADYPFQIGDCRTTDAVGHDIESLLADGFIFTYWVDHATKEVRITEIQKV